MEFKFWSLTPEQDATLQRAIAPDEELLKQHAANVDDLATLPERFRKAHKIKRALTRGEAIEQSKFCIARSRDAIKQARKLIQQSRCLLRG